VLAPVRPATNGPHIWLSSRVVPPAGADLAAFVINPVSEALHYGSLGTFERWSGSSWEPAGAWTSSRASSGGFGGLFARPPAIPAIRFSAPATGIGDVEYFRVPPLALGSYRVGHAPAYGVFDVSDATPASLDFDDQRSAIALTTARPSLLTPAGGYVRLVTIPRATGVRTARDVRAFNSGISPGVQLEQRSDTGWAVIENLTARVPEGPRGHSDEVMVDLPALSPGPYRLVRHHRDAGPLPRIIWVTDELPPGLRLDQLGLAPQPQRAPPPRSEVHPIGAPPVNQDAARAAITAAFLNFWTPSADGQSVPTVEGGETLGPTLAAYLLRRNSVLDATISVEEITFIDATHAAVWFTISVSGTPMIHNHRGDALIAHGSWKMARSTFCELTTRAGVPCPLET
jgi:hypothetical protein